MAVRTCVVCGFPASIYAALPRKDGDTVVADFCSDHCIEVYELRHALKEAENAIQAMPLLPGTIRTDASEG